MRQGWHLGRRFRRVWQLGLIVGLLATGPLPATDEIASAESLDCASCHKGRRGQQLNDLGMYYELTRTIAGYEELTRRFSSCSTCHRGRPGDKRLTASGRRYRWFFEDMEGVREWVMSRHPATGDGTAAPPDEDEPADKASDG